MAASPHVASSRAMLALTLSAPLSLALPGRRIPSLLRNRIVALLLLVAAAASLGISLVPAEAAGPLASGRTDRQALQRMSDEELLKDIVDWEKKGGPEAAVRIWEVVRTLEQGRLEVLNAAVTALGHLRRAEDGPALVEWYGTTKPKGEIGMFYWSIMAALGQIGGPPACRFLVDTLRESDRGPDFNIDVAPPARAIRAAGCLPEEDLRRELWKLARHLWVGQGIEESALGFLRDSGDAEAGAHLARHKGLVAGAYRTVAQPKGPAVEVFYTLPEARAILLDPSLPWWVKRSVFDSFSHAAVAKEDLLDLFFSLAKLVYTEQPGWSSGNYILKEWGSFIIRAEKAPWRQAAGEAYLEGQRRSLRTQLTPEVFGRMNTLIDTLLARYREVEARRPAQAAPRAATVAPAGPSSAVRNAPPPLPDLPPRIQTTPFPEPGFFEVKSRLQRLELFGFDKTLRWLGLARTDLALALCLQEIRAGSNPEASKNMRETALLLLLSESRAAGPGSLWQSDPFAVWRVPPQKFEESPVGEAQANPETGEASLTFPATEERLVLLRGAGRTGCDLDVIRSGASPGEGDEADITYHYSCGTLPAGAWLAVYLDKAGGRPTVFLPGREKALDGTAIHIGPEGDREEGAPGQRVGEDLRHWFEGARKAVESWEETTLESAGGATGVAAFRKELDKEISRLRGSAPPR